MCTFLIANRAHPDLPVLIAANRDEDVARAATTPEVLAEAPRVVGGRDVAAGGTWLGVAETGLFVGVTNQRSYGRVDRGLRTRGRIVLEALRTGTFDGVERYLETLDAREYNSFNLLFADAHRVKAAYGRREQARVVVEPVPPGVHVLTNDRLDAPDFAKVARATALAEALPLGTAPWGELAGRLHAMLADHERPPLDAVALPPEGTWTRELARELQAICIHTPAFGTRSAAIVALVPGAVEHYLYTAGPPCSSPLQDATPLLR